MRELEKKFYNWLMLNYCVPIKPEKIAHDLAKIAGKEFKLVEKNTNRNFLGYLGGVIKATKNMNKNK